MRAIPPPPRAAGGLRSGAANPVAVAATQEALYQAHDLELSWSEASLPERERTEHVHRLHPYLGESNPQSSRRCSPATRLPVPHSRPVRQSGTTLVQLLESGHDATGIDVAAFNGPCVGQDAARYNLESPSIRIRVPTYFGLFDPRPCFSSEHHKLRASLVRSGNSRRAARSSGFLDRGVRVRRRAADRGARAGGDVWDLGLGPRTSTSTSHASRESTPTRRLKQQAGVLDS